MAKFNLNNKVKIKQQFWTNGTPPRGVVVNKFNFADILNGSIASTERQIECAIRDSDKCSFGYDVYWTHNGTTNSWSEYELETA